MQKNYQKTLQENALLKISLKGKDEMREIDVYDAETKRLAVMTKVPTAVNPQEIQSMVQQMVVDILSQHLTQDVPQGAIAPAGAQTGAGGDVPQGPPGAMPGAPQDQQGAPQ